MGSTILPLIALVILILSGASARKCYECVHATGYDLSELPDIINSTIVTAACSSGTGIPAEFIQECNDEDPVLNVIRETINAISPEIGKKVNSILDQLSTKLAKNHKQAEYVCATLDVAVKLNLPDIGPLDIGVATGRTCVPKEASGSDFCDRKTGQQLVDEMKQSRPEDVVDEWVTQITAIWTNFLDTSMGVCVCDTDLCVKKAPVTGGGGGGGGNGSGVIEVFAPLTLISAILSMVLLRK